VEGHVGTFLDRDWFAATLVAGEDYRISLDSLVPGSVDPFLILRDAAGVELARNDDISFELNSLIAFRATTTGTHFIDAGLAESLSLGGYAVTLTDAISAFTDTTATVAVNRFAADVPVNGVIGGISDVDMYGVEFRRGDTYQIRLTGDGSAGQITDTIVRLHDNTGATLATNDDFVDATIGVRSSTLFFTAEETGAFFISADGFGTSLGGYSLRVFTDLIGHVTNADSLFGGTGGDVLQGLGGNDTLDGGKGSDTVQGGNNNDSVLGGRGNDDLFGNQGDDTLDGGRNDDRLTGGDGADLLIGGDGRDAFVYLDRREGSDRISGFTFDVDVIDLSAAGVTGLAELTITQQGADTLIEFGRSSILLEGFTFVLFESDFIFA
jgi:Ca2+-binding RTX toxin-like protein